jgi:hypothetical protein
MRNAGKGKNSIAQDFANSSHRTVKAFSGYVLVDPATGPYVPWYNFGGPVTLSPR